MKKIFKINLVLSILLITRVALCQGFIEAVEAESFPGLYGNPCIINLANGEVVEGKFAGANYVNNGLSKISIKLANGEKIKYEPEDLIAVRVKVSSLLKLLLVSESGSSIQEFTGTDFNEIIVREYIIFETELTPKKTDTHRLLQLVNPGFDSKIKVFAEPRAKTGGWSVNELQLTGGEDAAFLFVKGSEKAVTVKKGSYAKNFEELFSDCPEMLSSFHGYKIKWEDVALHVFVYDQVCR